MKKIVVVCISILIFTFLIITNVFADDTNIGKTPDGVFPINNADVVMVSEDINVHLDDGKVICNFVFKNTNSEPQDIIMGFPAEWDESSEEAKNFLISKYVFTDFKTYINGKVASVKKEAGVVSKYAPKERVGYKNWFTFKVHFRPYQQLKIKNTYTSQPSVDSMGYVFCGYILKTGAFWKGNIGYAKVTFELGKIKPYEIQNISPKDLKFSDNSLIFEKSDFEPNSDLSITYNQHIYSDEFLKGPFLDNDKKTAMQKEIDLYSKIENTNDTAQLISYYEECLPLNNIGLRKYILSKLPIGALKNDKSIVLGLSVVLNSNGDFMVNSRVKDDFGDLEQLDLKISHIESGREIVDYEESSPCTDNSYDNQGSFKFQFDQLDVRYKIELLARDSAGQTATKIINYLANPKEATEIPSVTSNSISVDGAINSTANDGKRGQLSWYWILTIAGAILFLILAIVYFYLRLLKGKKLWRKKD